MSCPKKSYRILPLIFLLIMILLPRHSVYAGEPCRSRYGGFCVKLSASDALNPSRDGFINNPEVAQAQISGIENFLNLRSGSIGDIVEAIYKFGVILVAVSALIMMTLGGIYYMLGRAADGKTFISNAVWGIVIVLLSWLTLYTINPDLVTKFQLNLKPVFKSPNFTGGVGGGGPPSQLTP